MTSSHHDLIELSDWAYQRLQRRLDGLTDDEYFWEPVPGSRSVRRADDGTYRSDGPGDEDEEPAFTTFGWRLSHIISLLGEERNWTWLGHDVPAGQGERDGDPGGAHEAMEQLTEAYDRWRELLVATTEKSLAGPIGDAAPDVDASRRAFVLHVLDELIHHGAEVALMRDLYRAAPAAHHNCGRAVHR